jgi:hypothetical protein
VDAIKNKAQKKYLNMVRSVAFVQLYSFLHKLYVTWCFLTCL